MAALRNDIDPDGLLEYSVVYTDRALNHMSGSFQAVMKDISAILKEAYNAESTAVVPGGGTYAMEAVARQFAAKQRCMVLRNGWFSYRWSQILDTTNIAEDTQVINAERSDDDETAPFKPASIDDVCEAIRTYKPDVFFAPHVETSAGMILPDDYLVRIGAAVADADGLFILDCIASGTVWVDMKDMNIDVVISAPQKGWSGPACAGLVAMSARADALRTSRDQMQETKDVGFAETRKRQEQLGSQVRAMLAKHGLKSVAASGFEAPGVVVVYTDKPAVKNGSRFMAEGVQVAAGVPLMVGEGDAFSTVRFGLFGLDKLADIPGAVQRLETAVIKAIA